MFADIPRRARNYECELKVREHAPYIQRRYQVPYSKRRAVQAELDKMLEGDIIERSVSPYSNPLVVVIKKDGRVRSVSYTHLDVYKRQEYKFNYVVDKIKTYETKSKICLLYTSRCV